ncbi:uncharacterized protein LOC112638311 [Camponotus floridanus]|uniref:uncharacterized protein LOC112638311 n=1 Tax=Camponotus floridanus TaxID=104421 RepID=UPI000DC69422|nr:uncharacterized protein LOC112638311 [Camponotus floridanus]
MFASKFGVSTRRRRGRDATSGRLRASVESLRNYVRDNALCLAISDVSPSALHYDARRFKIRGVTWPTNNDDATNKSYVESVIHVVRANVANNHQLIESVRTRVDNNAASSVKKIVALSKKIDALESAATERSSALETDVTQIRARGSAFENRLQTLENLQELAATRIETVETERSASCAVVDKRLGDLESSVETNRANGDASSKLLRELGTSELTAKALTSNAKLRELDVEVARLRKDANELARRTAATTTTATKAAAKAAAATAAISKTIDPNKVVIQLGAKTPDKQQSKRG